MNNLNDAVGPIHAMAVLTVDFGLSGSLPLDQLPAVIERDRMHTAKRPGLRQKHLPFRINSRNGNYLSGGRGATCVKPQVQRMEDVVAVGRLGSIRRCDAAALREDDDIGRAAHAI